MVDLDINMLSEEEQIQILLEAQRMYVGSWDFKSLEELISSEDGFGIDTITPLQRAICRIIEGVPLGDLAYHEHVQKALDYKKQWTLNKPPFEIILLAGVRTFKSLLAAAHAIWSSQMVDTSHLLPGEIPRYPIFSLELDNAKVVLSHLLGILSKPKLKGLTLDEQEVGHWKKLISDIGDRNNVGSVFLWSKSRRPVEIRVLAGKRAGGSAVSRWLFGLTVDEAARMVGAAEGVVNYDDTKRAAQSRILSGGQILSVSSPWQPQGPIYDIVQKDLGKPTEDRVVIQAQGPWLNPYWWTPERCAQIERSDPTVYQTDVLGEFADAEESLFPQSILEACSRENNHSIPYEEGHDYRAAIDPATRGNAWTLLVGDRYENKKRIVYHKQWQGTSVNPISPLVVLREVGTILKSYRLSWCYTDQWSADALLDIATSLGFTLSIDNWTAANRVDMFETLSKCAGIPGLWEIPKDQLLIKDLRMVKKIPKAGGNGYSIRLTQTTDGRHCDYAPPAARLFKEWIDEEFDMPPKQGEPGYMDAVEREMLEQELKEFEEKKTQSWWERDPDDDFDEEDRFYDFLKGIDL